MKLVRLALDYARKFVLSGTAWLPVVAFMLLAVVYVLVAADRYSATVTVLPASVSNTTTALDSLPRSLGGQILGLGLRSGSSEDGRNLQMLKSRRLALAFIHEKQLYSDLFPDRWDPEAGEWRQPEARLLSFGGNDDDVQPSEWQIVQQFRAMTKIRTDEYAGTTMVTMTLSDPDRAASLANDFIQFANRNIQQLDLASSEQNIAYLREQLEAEGNAGLIGALSSLVEEQMRRMMLASSTSEYAFSTIDPAIPPEEPTGPGALLVLVFAFSSGIAIGAFLLVLESILSGPQTT